MPHDDDPAQALLTVTLELIAKGAQEERERLRAALEEARTDLPGLNKQPYDDFDDGAEWALGRIAAALEERR